MHTRTPTLTNVPFIFCLCVCGVGSACLENTNLLQCDWYMWEQSAQNRTLCLLMQDLLHKKLWVNDKNRAQPEWPKTNTPQAPTSYFSLLRALGHPPTPRFHNPSSRSVFLPFHKPSHAATLRRQGNVSIFPKSSFIFFYSLYVFFNHFIYVRGHRHFYEVPTFLCHGPSFWALHLALFFS